MSQRIAHKIATAYAPPPEYDSSREIIPLLKERGELGFLLGDPVGRAGLVSRYSPPPIPLPKDEPGAREGRNAVIPIVGSRKWLDPRQVKEIVESLGRNPSDFRGEKSRA